MPTTLSLILGGDIPGLVAVTPASAAAAKPGTFSATAMIEVTAVNRGGDVAGYSGGHTLLVHNGTMTELGTGEATASTTSARSWPTPRVPS